MSFADFAAADAVRTFSVRVAVWNLRAQAPCFLPPGMGGRAIEDGGIEIDNNAAERSLRGVALGHKNYLFAGSDAGGERAAAMYSLSGSARLNGLDPEAYLRQGLVRIRGPAR